MSDPFELYLRRRGRPEPETDEQGQTDPFSKYKRARERRLAEGSIDPFERYSQQETADGPSPQLQEFNKSIGLTPDAGAETSRDSGNSSSLTPAPVASDAGVGGQLDAPVGPTQFGDLPEYSPPGIDRPSEPYERDAGQPTPVQTSTTPSGSLLTEAPKALGVGLLNLSSGVLAGIAETLEQFGSQQRPIFFSDADRQKYEQDVEAAWGKDGPPKTLLEDLVGDPAKWSARKLRRLAKKIPVDRGGYGGLVDAVQKKDYDEAAKMAVFGFLEFVPQLAAMLATKGQAGGMMGMSAAGNKAFELDENHPDMEPTKRAANILSTALMERIAEQLGTGKLVKKLFGNSEFKRSGMEKIKDVLTSAGTESTEEGVTQAWENLTDMATGVKDWSFDGVWDGVGEAAAMGGVIGKGMGTISALTQGQQTPDAQPEGAIPDTPQARPTLDDVLSGRTPEQLARDKAGLEALGAPPTEGAGPETVGEPGSAARLVEAEEGPTVSFDSSPDAVQMGGSVARVGNWEELPRAADNWEQLPDGRLVGYRVSRSDGGRAVSGADSRQSSSMEPGAQVEFKGDGVFVTRDLEYAKTHYGVHDANAVQRVAFSREEITSGRLADAEPEISVRSGEVVGSDVFADPDLAPAAQPDAQTETVYHGGGMRSPARQRGLLFTSADREQAEAYATARREERSSPSMFAALPIQSIQIDPKTIASESTAKQTMSDLNISPADAEWSLDESSLYELLDPAFEQYIGDENVDTFRASMVEQGFTGVRFIDQDIRPTGTGRQTAENIALFQEAQPDAPPVIDPLAGEPAQPDAQPDARTDAPRVFLTREEVSDFKPAFGESRLQVTETGEILNGKVVTKDDLPPVLFHVTTKSGAVVSSGVLQDVAQGEQAGLGKGTSITHRGVSLTRSRDSAIHMQRELTRNVEAARTQEPIESFFKRIAREDEVLSGAKRGDLDGAVRQAVKQANFHGTVFDGMVTYRGARESATGVEDPIIFGSRDTWAAVDPQDIGIVEVRARDIPDAALIRNDPVGLAQETIVSSDVPISPRKPDAQPDAPPVIDPLTGEQAQAESETPMLDALEAQVSQSESGVESETPMLDSMPDAPPVIDPLAGEQAQAEPEQEPRVDPEGKAYSIKNEATDARREEMGLPPVYKEAQHGFGERVWGEAMETAEADPTAPERVVSRIQSEAQKRDAPTNLKSLVGGSESVAVSAKEQALLLHHNVTLETEYESVFREREAARETGDAEAESNAEARLRGLELRMNDAHRAYHLAGTAASHSMHLRKLWVQSDFSITTMTSRRSQITAELVEQGEMTPEQRNAELEEVRTQHAEIQALAQKEVEAIDTADERAATKQSKRVHRKLAGPDADAPAISPEVQAVAERIIGRLNKRRDAAIERLKKKGYRFHAGIDLSDVADYTDIAVAAAATTGRDFALWSAEMIRLLGDTVKPHLDELYKVVRDGLDNAIDAMIDQGGGRLAKRNRASVKGAITGKTVAEVRDAALQRVSDKVDEGAVDDIHGAAQALAKSVIGEGVKDRDAVVDRVHEMLREVVPEITRRDTMDAISGYGRFRQRSKKEINRELGRIRGELQNVAKLQDMQSKTSDTGAAIPGRQAKLTGLEQREKESEELRLIAKVNELKRKGGFLGTNAANNLKSALAAVKTRLNNQIKSLEHQIEHGPIVKKPSDVQLDEEAMVLRARRDELREQFTAIFGKKELTDEQRVSRAIAAVEKSTAELQRRIDNRDLFPEKKKSKTPNTKELQAAKAERDALKAELKELQLLANPKPTPEEAWNVQFQKRAARQIADMERRLAEGDFSKRETPEYKPDEKTIEARKKLQDAKRVYSRAHAKHQRSLQGALERTGDILATLSHTSRATVTSSDYSAVGRQGGMLFLTNPVTALKIIPGMIRAGRSQSYYDKKMIELQESRYYDEATADAGLFISDINDGSLLKAEEELQSRWINEASTKDKGWKGVWGHLASATKGSGRAFSFYLNVLRMEVYTKWRDALSDQHGELPIGDKLALAADINVLSGRGSITNHKQQQLMQAGTSIFFSPRLNISRLQAMANPLVHGVRAVAPGKGIYSASRETQLFLLKQDAKIFALIPSIYALAVLMGAEVEDDPRSSKFLTARWGNVYIDFTMGLRPWLVLAARVVTLEKTTGTGRVVKLAGGGYADTDMSEVWARFLRSKLNPALQTLATFHTSETYMGDYVKRFSLDMAREASLNLVIPLSWQEAYDGAKVDGTTGLLGAGGASVVGWGAMSFENKPKKSTGGGSKLRFKKIDPNKRHF